MLLVEKLKRQRSPQQRHSAERVPHSAEREPKFKMGYK